MTSRSEYSLRSPMKPRVQRLIPRPFAFLGILLLFVTATMAQHESASVSTSAHASAPAVTSFSHSAPGTGGSFSGHTPHSPGGPAHTHNNWLPTHHHGSGGEVFYPYVYGVPYFPDAPEAATSDEDQDDDAGYQGGPTVFDRRGSGASSYVPPTYEGPAHAGTDLSSTDSNPEPPQPSTTLVFKDGRLLEVENYAIVNQTLYDLTPGHARKIALSDLDLAATEKQNDDRGVIFQLPSSTQAN
jgi:hypothetical protein